MWDSSENSLKQSFPKGETYTRDEPRWHMDPEVALKH